jgi:hypothetical protein
MNKKETIDLFQFVLNKTSKKVTRYLYVDLTTAKPYFITDINDDIIQQIRDLSGYVIDITLGESIFFDGENIVRKNITTKN